MFLRKSLLLVIIVSSLQIFCTEKLKSSESTDTEHLNTVSDTAGTINVYFNKSALPEYAMSDNEANYDVNLEDRLLHRINTATETIDLATYEINLENVVNALIEKASQGLDIRVIADAKDPDDPNYTKRYETMRLYLEKMARGSDMTPGTDDDIILFSDSPVFAVEDSATRVDSGLPRSPDDYNYLSVQVGGGQEEGYLIADAEKKSNGNYYSPGQQMHNKFVIFDSKWVFTGSWNFTETGLENQQHEVEMHSPELADIYFTEFNEMWGSNGMTPDPGASDFHGRKSDNTLHELFIGGRKVNVYFSPGDDAVGHLTALVRETADSSAYFTIFAWSDQAMVDELKFKWEADYDSLQGTLTGFDLKGVFDSAYWNQWWSASVDMTGREASRTSSNNPNTRWANPAPVFKDAESRKLHSKTMIIDAGTGSDPAVATGSTNWSQNGNEVNDENMIFIHDELIVNQFYQEFMARYKSASGDTLNIGMIDEDRKQPIGFSLKQNYPNPFNSTTTIPYTIPQKAIVSIKIFDISGRLMETLIDAVQKAGKYNIHWIAEDFSSGIYLCKIISQNAIKTRKMVLIK